MATVFTESNYLSEVLQYEADPLYCRDRVTVLSGQDLVLGTVVGTVTASGKVKILAPTASDGSQTASGVLLYDCDATSADNLNGVMVARQSIVKDTGLVWPAGITAGQKTTAIANLKAIGILVRAGV